MTNDIDIVGRFITSAIVTGVLLPLLLHFLRRRDEGRRRVFDIRCEEYRLTRLDEIAEASRIDFEAAFTCYLVCKWNSGLAGAAQVPNRTGSSK
jgi:hypothetical protein